MLLSRKILSIHKCNASVKIQWKRNIQMKFACGSAACAQMLCYPLLSLPVKIVVSSLITVEPLINKNVSNHRFYKTL